MSDRLFELFRIDAPLHILRDEEPGIDVHMLFQDLSSRFGVKARFVRPADLRLLPDPIDTGRKKLYCALKSNANGTHNNLTASREEPVEEIIQLGMELLQHEMRELSTEMLRHISLVCFNDMRTILLVHDKRMLGIVRQELGPLVARKVITKAQAGILDKRIAETILPCSPQLERLFLQSRSCRELRHQYILKPVRGGRGIGIIFGDATTSDVWETILKRMRLPGMEPEDSYVIQKRIIPRMYDMILDNAGNRVQYPLVGTYHVINGRLLGLGIWRSNNDRICAISSGGTWLCSVIRKEELDNHVHPEHNHDTIFRNRATQVCL